MSQCHEVELNYARVSLETSVQPVPGVTFSAAIQLKKQLYPNVKFILK